MDEYYKSVPFTRYHKKWETNIISDEAEFREILGFLKTLPQKLRFNEYGNLDIRLAENGYFISEHKNYLSRSTIEVGCVYEGELYVFVFWPGRGEDIIEAGKVTGSEALRRFKKHCGKIATKYEISDNEEIKRIKQDIPKPWIKLTMIGQNAANARETLYNVFHIDINSAYPACICKECPEFYDYFNDLFIHRKEHPENKAYLNYVIGAFQSEKIRGKRYPELARIAKQGTNDYLTELTEKITSDPNFIVLGYNTDGIFIQSRDGSLYHDEDEGTAMGQWKIDHVFDKIRFKKAGIYEYVENGEYHPVARGIPRSQSKNFVWGDIFKHSPKIYYLKGLDLITEEIRDEEI